MTKVKVYVEIPDEDSEDVEEYLCDALSYEFYEWLKSGGLARFSKKKYYKHNGMTMVSLVFKVKEPKPYNQ